MRHSLLIGLSLAASLLGTVGQAKEEPMRLVFACKDTNDLFRTATACKVPCRRVDTPAEAVEIAEEGAGVLLLADGYPAASLAIPAGLLEAATRKGLRLYVEFPQALVGREVGKPSRHRFQRAVVSSDFFGEQLGKLRIMQLGDMCYVPVQAPDAHLVAARVAGFDRAVYGLPEETMPLLFPHSPDVLVATTGFSHFVRSRFAPKDAMQAFWQAVFAWLGYDLPVPLDWQPVASPSYGPDDKLPADAQRQAIRRGLAWYDKAALITGPAPGDGTAGIREGIRSTFEPGGGQPRSMVIRGDCVCESAMTLALGTKLGAPPRYGQIAQNALDYYLFKSAVRKGERADPEHGAYGLIASGEGGWLPANYGDGNAKIMFGTLASAALLGTDRWDEAVMMCLLANLRTTGIHGFRGGRIDVPALANGYRQCFDSARINPHPHYEAFLWAAFLWAYEQTGYKLFLERPKSAIQLTMARFPDRIPWTNGLTQEKARLLLPLAWLVRVEDTPENRALLQRVVREVVKLQAPCGAIREEIGALEFGRYPPPRSNEEYGKHEASLIGANGDPVADLLYSTNFALLGLHEAARATGDPETKAAEDRLAEFLCRIQVRSEGVPETDGGWFRAFDYQRWEPWASNADAGWGAWCIEAGWTQSWIVSILAMRELDTSLWDLTHNSRIERHFAELRQRMLPDDTPRGAPLQRHLAWQKPVTLSVEIDRRYPATGPTTLTDGALGTPEQRGHGWLGFEGKDVLATIDLQKAEEVARVSARFLQERSVGIHAPRAVRFSVSTDNQTFTEIGTASPTDTTGEMDGSVHTLSVEIPPIKARYVRAQILNAGPLPKGRLLRDGRRATSEKPSWVFIDEILVDGRE